MYVTVIDQKSIYTIIAKEDANNNDILQSYMTASGNSFTDEIGLSYQYLITKHSNNLYSIDRELENSTMYFTLGLINTPIDIVSWWASVYPIIEQISVVGGAVSAVGGAVSAAVAFVKWVRELTPQRGNDEYELLEIVLNEYSWNVSELSVKLSIPEDNARYMLKGFGYIWDRHKLLYVETEETKKIRMTKFSRKFF